MAEFIPLILVVFIISVIGTVLIENRLIPFLCRRAEQPIYEDGPQWHLKKRGTPTMGGIAFLIAVSIALALGGIVLVWGDMGYEGTSVFLILVFSAFNSLIGIIDDLTKLHRKNNAGLTPVQKLVFQFVFALAFLFLREYLFLDGTEVDLGATSLDFGFLYYPVMAVMIVGIVNFANLTDGVDGLASSVAVGIGTSLLFISASVDTALVSVALIGGGVAFLFFNIHPAKIFMGDTGSLFFGAMVVYAAFTLETPILIIIISSVYVIEGLSVIIQVLWYKATKKRIFKMAPLHHHLEKCGWSETKICLCALILTLVASLVAFGVSLL